MSNLNNNNLKYAFCEDWFIYATDENDILHYVLTECWPEWSNFPNDADREEKAVEKYMLPLALKKWHRLSFIKTENKFKEVIRMNKEYKYQSDVTATIYDDHDCIIWTAYDKEGQDFEEVLILDIPGKEQKEMNNNEKNKEYFLGLIDKYLMGY